MYGRAKRYAQAKKRKRGKKGVKRFGRGRRIKKYGVSRGGIRL